MTQPASAREMVIRPETAVTHRASTSARPLSRRQWEVLRFIVAYEAMHGQAPSIREMAAHMGRTSTNWINQCLVALERKGWISRRMYVARGLRVLVQPPGRWASKGG